MTRSERLKTSIFAAVVATIIATVVFDACSGPDAKRAVNVPQQRPAAAPTPFTVPTSPAPVTYGRPKQADLRRFQELADLLWTNCDVFGGMTAVNGGAQVVIVATCPKAQAGGGSRGPSR